MQCPSYIISQLNSLKGCYQAIFSGWNDHFHSQAQVVTASIQADPFERREGKRTVSHAAFNFLTRQDGQLFSPHVRRIDVWYLTVFLFLHEGISEGGIVFNTMLPGPQSKLPVLGPRAFR